MMVANSNPSSKPNSTNSQDRAEECRQALETMDKLMNGVKRAVQDAARAQDSFDHVERTVQQTMLQVGYQAMSVFVALQGDGDVGESVETEKGKTLRRSEKPSHSTIRSIFGTHSFHQYTYAAGKNKAIEFRPISARMGLPAKQWSFLLQEFAQMLAVDQAYEQAMRNLGQFLGGTFSVDTAEQVNGDMGEAAGAYLADLPLPEPESEAKLLVASADCKGVPLVKRDAAKVPAFETGKKRPGNRRMATVASVYTVDPHFRTAEDVTAALFRDTTDEETERVTRPKPQNKNTTAHFPCAEDNGAGGELAISGIHVAMAWLIGQVALRRRAGQVLIALMDGQESLWETMKLHIRFTGRTVPILDILHALAYIWEAAALFEKTDKAKKTFARERLLRILRGEIRGVIRGLRRLGTMRRLTGKARKDLVRICGYLEKNADRMRYDEYLRRGYPIASGVIEGACRHLVKDRMERSGMRWTLEGARNMLHVRAAFQSDHWRAFLDDRREREVARLHPHRDLLEDYQPMTIAC